MRLVSAASFWIAYPSSRDPQRHFFLFGTDAGATTFHYWWLAGDKGHVLIRAAAVLIIACPHALACHSTRDRHLDSLGAQNGCCQRQARPRAASIWM